MDSVFTNDIKGRRESPGCRGLARGHEFDLQNLHKKARPVVYAWNPSSGDRDGREADP